MVEIFMPKAGMDMKEGVLIRWLKEVGEPVELDEPIMEIETDKITMEAEAPGTGILLEKVVEAGSVVPVLSVLGYIGQPGEKIQPGAPRIMNFETKAEGKKAEEKRVVPATPYAKKLAVEQNIDLTQVAPAQKDGIIYAENVRATSLARRVAAENQVDLKELSGSGKNGKIVKQDVVDNIAAKQNCKEEKERSYRTAESRQVLKGVRKVVGKRMFESYSQVPTVMQSMKVDMTELLEFRKKVNEGRNEKISLNDFILKATAIAVKEMPHVRTMVEEDELVTYKEANIGFAVAVEDGLYVPVIKNADLLSVGAISRQAKELAEKARNGTIRPDEYSGGTFSVSNMGMFDVYTFNPIINQPESGILGITGIEDVLKLTDGQVTVRKEAVLCMSYDHRVMDGVGAARFKKRVKELIEHPMEILV